MKICEFFLSQGGILLISLVWISLFICSIFMTILQHLGLGVNAVLVLVQLVHTAQHLKRHEELPALSSHTPPPRYPDPPAPSRRSWQQRENWLRMGSKIWWHWPVQLCPGHDLAQPDGDGLFPRPTDQAEVKAQPVVQVLWHQVTDLVPGHPKILNEIK